MSSGLMLGGLWQRRWLSLAVLVVATIATAAAALGPTYADAAITTTLRDAFAEAGPEAHGYMVTFDPVFGGLSPGSIPEPDDPLLDEVLAVSGLPEAFHPPIPGLELTSGVDDRQGELKLIWRADACGHLVLEAGRCPSQQGEVVASVATSERYGWTVGGAALLESLDAPELLPTAVPDDGEHTFPLTIVGLYEPLDVDEDYWLGQPYFPDSTDHVGSGGGIPLFDPLFTVPETFERVPARPDVEPPLRTVTVLLDQDQLVGGQARALQRVPRRVERWAEGDVVFSDIDRAASQAVRDQDALGVPVTVVVLELLALCWLLLFLTVAELVQARRLEIGLARLRGLSRTQVWRFGLTEPLVLLALAYPVGVLVAWPLAALVASVLLRPDVVVHLSGEAWVAGAAAAAGGLAAALLAARSTLTTPLVEQWRRASSRPSRRSWVPDAVVLTLVAAGLFELAGGGVVTDATRQDATSLLVPAILAVGAALVTARLLPYACRAVFGVTRRRGGLGSFLAVRQVARAPRAAHGLVILAGAFALVAFGVSAWSVTSRNHHDVAQAHVGADHVLVVSPPTDAYLPDIVAEADPDGRSAVAVARTDASGDLIAVDSTRFAQVAQWRDSFAATPLTELLPRLRPELPPRVVLSGERIRVHVDAGGLQGTDVRLFVTLHEADGFGPTVIDLPAPDTGQPTSVEDELPPGCHDRCELRGIGIALSSFSFLVTTDVVISEIETYTDGGWRALDAGLDTPDGWRGDAEGSGSDTGDATSGPRGLRLVFDIDDRVVAVPNVPTRLPAIVVGPVDVEPGGRPVEGFDGERLEVISVADAQAAPGATGPSAVVDYEVADRAAFGRVSEVEHQVWVVDGAERRIAAALEDLGVSVDEVRTPTELEHRFNRQGPGLALVLLLVFAGAGAALAMARVVLALYSSGRRRAYELAALSVINVPAKAQRMALLVEQAVTLGAGALVGVASGLAAATLALDRVPQFTSPPSTPPLTTTPDVLQLVAVVAVAIAAAGVAVVLTTEAIRRSARVEQIREAPP